MKKSKSGSHKAKGGESPSKLIDARIEELNDWRGEMLARIRLLIKQAVPGVVEEWKWRGVPVWYDAGMICTGETYKNVVKVTFAKGAALEDPAGLFNSSLEGNTRRAIDFHEGDKINEKALKALIAPPRHSTQQKALPGRGNLATTPSLRRSSGNSTDRVPSAVNFATPRPGTCPCRRLCKPRSLRECRRRSIRRLCGPPPGLGR